MSSNIKCSSHLSFFFCLRIPNTRSNLQPILSFFTSNASWYRWNQKQNWFWYIFSFVDRYRQTSALLFLRCPLWYQPLRRYFFFVEIYKQVFLIFVFHWADAAELEKLGVKSVPSTLIDGTLCFGFCSILSSWCIELFVLWRKIMRFYLKEVTSDCGCAFYFCFLGTCCLRCIYGRRNWSSYWTKERRMDRIPLRPTPYEYMHYFDV